ncbi:hypothetical protein [Aquimarina sp. RZ0]|uniref:hypothetical protein n=1 Tax=Aquimarina sp. RZ0 TaxID=2607730 RepID=UPI0011F3F8D9|nr:hypothetical protein [Aquimarina sp. RZ0]KAA1242579.1 hypothetical protein F0000_24990 [Aquimarina sp. RZ0]
MKHKIIITILILFIIESGTSQIIKEDMSFGSLDPDKQDLPKEIKDSIRKKVVDDHKKNNPGKPPLTPEEIDKRVEKQEGKYREHLDKNKEQFEDNDKENKEARDKINNAEIDYNKLTDTGLMNEIENLKKELEESVDSEEKKVINESQDQFNNLADAAENSINNLPDIKDIKDLKNLLNSKEHLQAIKKSIKQGDQAFDLIGASLSSGKLPNQTLALLQIKLQLLPPWILPLPAFSLIKGKDKGTREYMESVRNSAMVRAAGMKFTEKAVKENVARYSDRLHNQYTKSKYDKKTGFASKAILRMLDVLVQKKLTDELDKTNFGITKNKKEMAQHLKMDMNILGALGAGVDVKNMTPAQRQEIYRLRRNLLRQLGENSRISRDQLLLPTVAYFSKNPEKAKKLLRLLKLLEPLH